MRFKRVNRWINTAAISAAALGGAVTNMAAAEFVAPGATIAATIRPNQNDAAARDNGESARIRFSFQGATFQQVIEFFSRETGLPVVWEADPPEGTLNYRSPDAYAMPEALRVLNIILQSRGVMLRVNDDMLYLRKLTEMQRSDIPTFIGQVPAEVTSDQIITVVRPLNIALAKPMAERLAQMVAAYGSVTALEQQNSIVLTETAAQVRRLLTIVEELDRSDPEGAIEIFSIRHASASALMEPLQALLSQRVEKYVIDQKGQQVKIEEDQMPGLTISADERTNSIIAKGTSARIDNLREAIALLDVPAQSGGRTIRTIALGMLSPQDAQRRLNEIYQRLPEPERPAVLASNELGQVTIVGSERTITEGAALLREIDGGGAEAADAAGSRDRRVSAIVLEHAEPGALINALRGLLNPRQVQMTKLVAGPDGRSVVISGPATDVEAVESVIPTLDRPVRVDRQVRILRLDRAGAEAIVDRAAALYDEQRDDTDPAARLDVEYDEDSRTATVIGSNQGIARFSEILRGLEATLVQRETRQIRTQHARPSELAETLRDVVARMLEAREDTAGPAPTIDAFDDLDLLLITATGGQLQSIVPLVQSLDVPTDRSVPPLRILQLRIADANNLASTLNRQYQQRPAEERNAKPVTISADPQTNSLIVAAHPDVLPEIQQIVEELNEDRRDYDGREIRIFPLKVARAEELARTIDEMFPQPPVPVDARGRPLPHLQKPREIVVRADRQTNSLIVDAPLQRMNGFEQLVEQLDRQQIMEETEVRTYEIVHAEVNTVAKTLRELASAGTLSTTSRDRRSPITISTEPMSRRVIVAGPADIFDRVEKVLSEMDVRRAGPETTLRFFKLEHARAETVANMLREVLLTRVAEDVPDAGADVRSLVNVSADRKTNTIILSAPKQVMAIAEELINQLDDSTASLGDPIVRVRPLTFADAREVAQSLATAMAGLISPATNEPMSVRITSAPGSNALILVGLEPDLKEVEALIEPLDARPATDAIDAKTFTLEFADAGTIAPIVQRLLTDQQETDPRIVIERIRRSRGQVDLTPKIRVEADQRTNSLIVSGPQQTVALAQTLIEQLDRPDDTADRTYATFTPLNAELNALTSSVQRVLDATASRGEAGRPAVELLPEPHSGSIVIIGSPEETERAAELLAQWDDKTLPPPQMDLRIVALDHTEANMIAQSLTGLLRDQSRWPRQLRAVQRAGLAVGQPGVFADAANNRVVVSAPQELMPIAMRMLEELDQPRAGHDAVDTRIFHLEQADAADVADAVRAALEAQQSGRPASAPRITVTIEPSSNAIIVTGPAEALGEVESLITPLDRGVDVEQPQVRTVFLQHSRAETIAPIVRELLAGEEFPVWLRYDALNRNRQLPPTGPDVRVSADARLNAIVIAAPKTVLDVAEQMIAQLDVNPSSVDGVVSRSVRVLTVDNADAGELAQNLTALFSEEDQPAAPPTIRVDRASNALLVRATPDQFRTIEEVVSKIDRATIATSRQMQLVPIDPSRATAGEVAEALRRMLDRSGSSSVQVITVEELRRRSRENIAAPDDPQQSSQLDQQDDSSRRMRRGGIEDVAVGHRPGYRVMDALAQSFIYSLFSAISAPSAINLPLPLAASLPVQQDETDDGDFEQFLEDSADITIAVDEATNSLIMIGSPRAVDRMTQLAQQIQREMPSTPTTIRYVALPDSVDAGGLTRLVNQTLNQMTPAGGQRGDLGRRVSIIPDTTANALIVAANDIDFTTVGDLIATLSEPAATKQIVVKVYPLETMNAERAATSVEAILAPDDIRTRQSRGRQEQRLRQLAITLMVGDERVEGAFDPDQVRLSPDPQTNSLIVMGPPEAIRFVDQYIELMDLAFGDVEATRSTLKLYPLQHARAAEMHNTLRQLFQMRFRSQRGRPGLLEPEFAVDDRTNTLIVTASPEYLNEIDGLLKDLDTRLGPPGEEMHELRTIELAIAQPSRAAQILDQVVLGTDQQRRSQSMIVADDNSGVLLVRASEEVNTEIDRVLGEIDRNAANEFPVRTITLERANAAAVANAVQRFYDDRARIASAARGRRQQSRSVSIIGDEASRTLLVAASDRDFEEIEELVQQFDSPAATQTLEFRVFELRHARATEIQQTVQGLVDDLVWNQTPFFVWPPPRNMPGQRDSGTLAIRADARLNALIVTGEGDKFSVVESIVEVLDVPAADHAQRTVELYRVRNANVSLIADLLRETFERPRRWWEAPDPTEVRVRMDEPSRMLIVSANAQEHAEIADMIASIDQQLGEDPRGEQTTNVLAVEFARAGELARTLQRFLADRARAAGGPAPSAAIVASDSANSLIVAAPEDELLTIRDLLERLDQPDVSGDRVIDIIALQDARAQDVARIVSQQFPRRGGAAGGQGVIITPDARTNALIVNAPKQQMGQVEALIDRLDSPSASDETIIRTYTLEGARAADAQRLLAQTLQLDNRGRTDGITIRLEDRGNEPVEVVARIVADRRSNSLIVTATEESFPVIEHLIRQLDEVPSVNPVEYRIVTLEHAMADDVSFTLRQMTRGIAQQSNEPEPRVDYNRFENQLIVAATPDQFKQIEKILEEIDVPSERQRVTNFVPLEFAEATQVQEALSVFYGPYAFEADTPGKRNVRIVADPASNSLVISADETEWEGIRALLKELDSEEYDASLQLRVLPLNYADSRSVARAINEAFQGTIERSPAARQQQRQRRDGDDPRAIDFPSVLVESQEWVRASAEPLTNSVIVSASRQNIRKIEQIIEQLDIADYAKLPAPRIIPVTSGNPQQLADALNRLYEQTGGTGADRTMGLRIVPDAASNAVIVRAEEDEFNQISALADALQQQAGEQGVSVRVLKLATAPAARVATALREAYQTKARQSNQPLSIQIDATGNALVIASTGGLFREIEETAEQLDSIYPGGGGNQSIFIIELEHVSPDVARGVIESIGLHQRQPEDSTARIVTEPIKVSTLQGRNALVIVANPADRETIVGFLKALDAEPGFAEAQMRVVRLKNADAASIARILGEVMNPASQQSSTSLARAIQEQVRRISLRRDGLDEPDLSLDLTKPIRVIPDERLNAIIVSSTESNVRAIEQVIGVFDQLPITGAATVQLFPLQNIAAEQFARIVSDLFTQGRNIGQFPLGIAPGVPAGMVGEALVEQIAITIDERTNTVVVAGREEAVALVEVLSRRLDSDIVAAWVEPRLLMLRHADANELAATLQAILVEGQTNLPQASPLQRQIGRLRVARQQRDGGRVLESDVFTPMTRLVIRPEPQMNALVLVGTPTNLEVVAELVQMLDVEAASPSASVRIYPVEHASAARLAQTITRLFDQQVDARLIRPEDRVIVQPDERTNTLIVTTTARSFAVLESLLISLDSEIAPDLREIRRVELKHASATRLAPLIQDLMDARMERLRRVQPETADLERATILPEPRTNSLLVAAGNESFDMVKRLAADLDDSTLGEAALVHVVPVPEGNVDRLAGAINQIMERRYADQPAEIRSSQRPLVLTDPRTNSLLVAANPEDFAAIEDLVRKLGEAPLNPAIGLHVVTLDGTARAEQLAQRLQRLMQERMQSLGDARTPSDRVSIEPDLATNSLIIAATGENLEIIRGLINVLGRTESELGVGREVEVIMLTTSRASDMIQLLNELHVREANRTRGENTVRVTADERLNAVLVNAPETDVEIIRGLVGRLDGAKPSTIVETRFIPLQSANAREVVSLIENVLSGRGIGAGRAGSRQATILKYVRDVAERQGEDLTGMDVERATEMLVGAAVRESITLTPDIRTNTVIVSAPHDSMQMIEQMVRDLDASSVGAQTIRIFKLTNADALAMAQILTDLFRLQQQGNIFVLRPREGPADDGGEMAGPETPDMSGVLGTELTAVPDERQQLSITVDSRTNSLLVSGTPTYLDLVERVVNELDGQEANERDVHVYKLRNAVADEVASVVGQFVDREQQRLVQTLGDDQIGAATRLLEREVTIVGDEKSNTVLISASPRYMDRVKDMIAQLDVDPPQVLIQVMLAEVTLDSADDWGVDLQAMGEVGSAAFSGGWGLASAFVTGMGVPNLAIASSDFDLLIRAMRAQGRLQVLSNPSVMAANNEEARIQVGETIRVPTGTSFSDAGRITSTLEAEEVGVILTVTPSINPDGFVRMEINPEISNISARTTQVSEDFEAPIITRRTADTTVTVRDGQTIIIGGLISDRFERRDQKVPLLGDLPLIGALFRSQRQETAKTELLIVLTPHVIDSPAERERMEELTGGAINRLSLPEELQDSIRRSRLAPTGDQSNEPRGYFEGPVRRPEGEEP